MTGRGLLEALFSFSQAMNERLWAIIDEHLTDAQFTQANDYSRGSIRNQIVHMAQAQHYWLRGLLNIPDLPHLQPEDYATRAAARAVCQQADREILDRVRGLSEADLERIPDGWSQPVWVGLLQNANHGTDHRAQILHALHGFGAPTFEQNFAVYMENVTPLSVEELAAQIEAKWTEWKDRLQQIPADQMDQRVLDSWTVRDGIAILMWKERRVVEIARRRVLVGLSFRELPEEEQARVLEASRALPLAALLEQHQATHRELLAALQTLTDDDLNSARVEGLPPDEPLWKAVASGTWWSYPTFSRPLREWLRDKAATR